jgi:hypothetical protein
VVTAQVRFRGGVFLRMIGEYPDFEKKRGSAMMGGEIFFK